MGRGFVIFIAVIVLQNIAISACKIPLYRYWAPRQVDHFYTTNANEIGTTRRGQTGRHGYISEGIQCYLQSNRVACSVPLYRYWKPQGSDHFYTTNANEIGTTVHGRVGRHGYRSEGIVGYCYPYQVPGTVPLYRYWKPHGVDHFYTTNINEIGTAVPGRLGRHGYVAEGVQCYVLPA